METKHNLSILVKNNSGLLLRVSGLFSRRGYNIQSISAAQTQDPDITRMTITVGGDQQTLEQIENQVRKLVDVIEVKVIDNTNAVLREHMIMKVTASDETRAAVVEIANLFKANIVDVGADNMMLELTGEPKKISGFINLIEPYGIIELMRTGVCGLERG
ncbi:MAG: acetolactate synthase small subunit [Oscillospiraceae bacterium]|nr:acetolactate synthase small subunit [Oscillospiraceae bacterium]